MTNRQPNLLAFNSYYLVGIKGVAMAALASCLLDANKQVSGTDVKENFVTAKQLAKLDSRIDVGFDGQIPDNIDCIIYSGAHGGSKNPVVLKAKAAGLPVFSHAEALASLFNSKVGIAICGVGGKSTTSAMLTYILFQLGLKPSYLIGVGEVTGLPATGGWQASDQYFVAEADDYVDDPSLHKPNTLPKAKFLYLRPHHIICTQVRYDHPDVYDSFSTTKEVFKQFFNLLPNTGTLLVDEENLKWLNQADVQAQLLTFGTSSTAHYQLVSYQIKNSITVAEVRLLDTRVRMQLQVPGEHNLRNALAAVAMATQLGIDANQAAKALSTFTSTQRRMEKFSLTTGQILIDDYAHHPAEITSIINTLQHWHTKQKTIIAFQPHTFSRTASLFDEFAAALSQADEVWLLPIFASAREQFTNTISSEDLLAAIKQHNPNCTTKFVPNIPNLAEQITQLPNNTIVATLGAGDIYDVQKMLPIIKN